MMLKFTVRGNPLGWQRTGQNQYTGAIFTQDKTRDREKLVAYEYRRQCGNYRFPNQTPIELRVYAYYQIPKSKSKRVREQMISGAIRPTVRPDYDNIAKLVTDALNGIAYDDDKSVVDAVQRKFYSTDPRVVVVIQEAKLTAPPNL